MAGGQVHHPQGHEVSGKHAGKGLVGGAEDGTEEDVQNPHEQHQDGAVDRVGDEGAEQCADRQIDQREHHRPSDHPARLATQSSACGERHQSRDGGKKRKSQAGCHAGGHQSGRCQAGKDQAAVDGACGTQLEVHGDGGNEAGGPSGGCGLHGRSARAAEQLGRIGQGTGGHDDEHHGDQHEYQQVHWGARRVGQETPDEQGGGHRGTACPSRSWMMRSKRSSSVTK